MGGGGGADPADIPTWAFSTKMCAKTKELGPVGGGVGGGKHPLDPPMLGELNPDLGHDVGVGRPNCNS